MKFTYYGHSCFEVETAGKRVLFDPFITGNELAKDVEIDSIRPDYILITHGHEDHVADVEGIAGNSNPVLVSNFEIITWFGGKGLENGHPMNTGGSVQLDFGKVKMVNAIHSSSLPDGSYGGNPTGFVVTNNEGTFYYAGDTALHPDMKQIGAEFDLDVAVLPIGDNFTMGIEDALIAADWVGADRIIGVHYDTFPYIEINREEALEKAAEAGKELILLDIGASLNL